MPVLATQSVESTLNDVNEEQTSVQLKEVKDGKKNIFYFFNLKIKNILIE
jgi:hypothetical protein